MRNFKNKKFLIPTIASLLCGIVFCALGFSFLFPKQTQEFSVQPENNIESNAVSVPPAGENWIDYAASSFASGTGTSADPFIISSAEELAYLAKTTNEQTSSPSSKYYKLSADIDLSGKYWTPIGDYNTNNATFNGYLYGENHTISGMYVGGTMQYAGLFGRATLLCIENLTIDDCVMDVNDTGLSGLCAGLCCGYFTGSGSTFNNITCTANLNATVTTQNGRLGGLCGVGGLTVEDCKTYGQIEISSNKSGTFIGGFIGYPMSTTIRNSENHADINLIGTGSASIGGFYGYNGITLVNCKNYGDITGSGTIGGLGGERSGTTTNCENYGKITISSGRVGGLFGYSGSAGITDSTNYGEIEISSTAYGGGIIGSNNNWGSSGNNLTLTNVKNEGNITLNGFGGTSYIGGLIGYFDCGVLKLTNVTNEGDITQQVNSNSSSYSEYIGGIFGYCTAYLSSTKSGTYLNGVENKGGISVNAGANGGTVYSGGVFAYLNKYSSSSNSSGIYYPQLKEVKNSANITITTRGTIYAGGIYGNTSDINVVSCINTGNISAISSNSTVYSGGLGGYVSEGSVPSFYNSGTISATTTASSSAYAGGLIAYGKLTASACYNLGAVSASGRESYAGGLIGFNLTGTSIDNSYNTANVSATSTTVRCIAGGLVGGNTNSGINLELMNLYNTGAVSSSSSSSDAYAGGVLGGCSGAVVQDCFNLGNVAGSGSLVYAHGIASLADTISNCYYDQSSTISAGSTAITNNISCGPVQDLATLMQSYLNFDTSAFGQYIDSNSQSQDATWSAEWLMETLWTFDTDISLYPVLTTQSNKTVTDKWSDYAAVDFAGGSGTQDDPYQIATASQLAYLAKQVNSQASIPSSLTYYKLIADITDLSTYLWVPIGDYNTTSACFYGSFDGDGHTISGYKVKGSVEYAGLFGYVKDGSSFKNFEIENANISVSSDNIYAGGVAAYVDGAVSFTDIDISINLKAFGNSCFVGGVAGRLECSLTGGTRNFTFTRINISGSISSKNTGYAGGLVGYMYTSASGTKNYRGESIINYAKVTGAVAGGICAYGSLGNIDSWNPRLFELRDSKNFGEVIGVGTAGGAVGNCYAANIINFENRGAVSANNATSYAGGITAYWASARTKFSNVVNYGNITALGTTSYAGGIAGYGYGPNQVPFYVYSLTNEGNIYSNAYAGGIFGYVKCDGFSVRAYSIGMVEMVNSGNVRCDGNTIAYAGGIAGVLAYSNAMVFDVSNDGDIVATTTSTSASVYQSGRTIYYYCAAGGIFGSVTTGGAAGGMILLANSYNNGDTQSQANGAPANSGGLVGMVEGTVNAKNIYSTGDNSATSTKKAAYSGGIIGNGGTSMIVDSFNLGGVSASGTTSYMHGITPVADIIKNCYYDSSLVDTNWAITANEVNRVGKVSNLSTLMKLSQNYEGMSFGTYTDLQSNVGKAIWDNEWNSASLNFDGDMSNYPKLRFADDSEKTYWTDDVEAFAGGDGSVNFPYQIANAKQLAYLAKNVNDGTNNYNGKYFELTEDIDLSEKYWVPIGNYYNNSFSYACQLTQLNGNNHTITGMKIAGSYTYTGLFGYVSSPKIKNLSIENSFILTDSQYTGGICGYGGGIYTDVSVNINIDVCRNGTAYIGGICGSSSINGTNVCTSGNICSIATGGQVGGIIGRNSGTITLTDCCNYIDIFSMIGNGDGTYVGGIVGGYGDRYNLENVKNCGDVWASTPSTTSTGSCASIVGGCRNYFYGSFKNCFNSGDLIVTYSYRVGGVIGYVYSMKSFELDGFINTGWIKASTDSGTVSTVGNVNVNNAKISNVLALGKVESSGQVSGIIGNCNTGTTIDNCVVNCELKSAASSGSPRVYSTSSATVTNCCFIGTINLPNMTSISGYPAALKGNSNYYYDARVIGKSSTQTYKGYSGTFDGDKWFFNSGVAGGYPMLKKFYWVGSSYNQSDPEIKAQLESLGITELAA